MKTIRQAVVIAGGKGARLGLKAKPKPLAMIGGVPVLGHIIRQCEDAGIGDILILASHMAEQIEAWASRYDGAAKITLIHDTPPMGTAGALKKAESGLDDEILITYGDMIFDVALPRMEKAHRAARADMTLLCQPNDHPFESDIAEIGGGLRIKRLFRPRAPEEMTSNMAASCIWLMKRGVLAAIPPGVHADLGPWVIDAEFCATHKAVAYISPEWINDIGTAGRLKACRRVYATGKAVRRRGDHSQPLTFHHIDAANIDAEVPAYRHMLRQSRLDRLNILVVSGHQPPGGDVRGDAAGEDIIQRIDAMLGREGVFFDEIILRRHGGISCRAMQASCFDLEVLEFILNPNRVSGVELRDMCQ